MLRPTHEVPVPSKNAIGKTIFLGGMPEVAFGNVPREMAS